MGASDVLGLSSDREDSSPLAVHLDSGKRLVLVWNPLRGYFANLLRENELFGGCGYSLEPLIETHKVSKVGRLLELESLLLQQFAAPLQRLKRANREEG